MTGHTTVNMTPHITSYIYDHIIRYIFEQMNIYISDYIINCLLTYIIVFFLLLKLPKTRMQTITTTKPLMTLMKMIHCLKTTVCESVISNMMCCFVC